MREDLKIKVDGEAIRRAEELVARFGAHHRISDADRNRVTILLEELLTNLQKYGYEGSGSRVAEISLRLKGDQLTVEFVDDGRAFDPLTDPLPELADTVESRPIGKVGLRIVRAFADKASYSRRNNHNVLLLVRRISTNLPST